MLSKHLSFGWFKNANRHVIFNSFSTTDTISLRQTSNVLRFGVIGRITEFKGIELLLRAFLSMGQDAKIELFYNRKRRHSSLDYKNPAQFEMMTKPTQLTLRFCGGSPLCLSFK